MLMLPISNKILYPAFAVLCMMLFVLGIPKSAKAQNTEARKAFMKGRFSLEDGRLVPAIDYFRQSLELMDGETGQAAGLLHYYLALAYYEHKNFDLAGEHIKEAKTHLSDRSQAPLLNKITESVERKLAIRDKKLKHLLDVINRDLWPDNKKISPVEFIGEVYNYSGSALRKIYPNEKREPKGYYPFSMHLVRKKNLYLEKEHTLSVYYQSKLPEGANPNFPKIFNYAEEKNFYAMESEEVLTLFRQYGPLNPKKMIDRSLEVTNSFLLDVYFGKIWRHPLFLLYHTDRLKLGEKLDEEIVGGKKQYKYEVFTPEQDSLFITLDATTLVPNELSYRIKSSEDSKNSYELTISYQEYKTEQELSYPSVIEMRLDTILFQSIQINEVILNSGTIDRHITQWNSLISEKN